MHSHWFRSITTCILFDRSGVYTHQTCARQCHILMVIESQLHVVPDDSQRWFRSIFVFKLTLIVQYEDAWRPLPRIDLFAWRFPMWHLELVEFVVMCVVRLLKALPKPDFRLFTKLERLLNAFIKTSLVNSVEDMVFLFDTHRYAALCIYPCCILISP